MSATSAADLAGVVDGPDVSRVAAGMNLLGRTGARDVHLEHHKLEGRDDEPVLWMAACWHRAKGGAVRNVAAANTARQAIFRLLEVVVDGGQCVSCKKPTGVTEDLDDMPAATWVCWYQYDPELQTYRRGCEHGS